MTTPIIRHINEMINMFAKIRKSAARTGYEPQFEAADLLLDCINNGLEDHFKMCECGDWHEEEGVFCTDCQNFEAEVLKDRLAWLGK